MARTIGATNRRGPDGIKLITGAGVQKVKVNPDVVPRRPKAQSGRSSTQGSKPSSRIPRRPTA